MDVEPDTKDWTWVLERPCPECGFDASLVNRVEVGHAIRENAAAWVAFLGRDGVTERGTPDRWSGLEYGCHVRDVLRIFDERAGRMLAEADPTFENWDQNETATHDRYELQDPSTVASELDEAAGHLAARYDAVEPAQWERPGSRSNGSRFTVETLALYGLHDPIHHLWDVAPDT